jgi:hypothetical protein
MCKNRFEYLSTTHNNKARDVITPVDSDNLRSSIGLNHLNEKQELKITIQKKWVGKTRGQLLHTD